MFFFPVDDDLSQEKNYWDNHFCQPESEGEIEMFHSQGFGFSILSFLFEMNFSDQQSSLEYQNVVFTLINKAHCDLLEPQNVIGEILFQCPFLVH